jgi:hypothetical protein
MPSPNYSPQIEPDVRLYRCTHIIAIIRFYSQKQDKCLHTVRIGTVPLCSAHTVSDSIVHTGFQADQGPTVLIDRNDSEDRWRKFSHISDTYALIFYDIYMTRANEQESEVTVWAGGLELTWLGRGKARKEAEAASQPAWK